MTRPLARRALTAAALALACGSLAACDEKQPEELTPYKQPLKNFLSDKLRGLDFKVVHTDDDPQVRPPTKYADAAKGVAFAIRHAITWQDGPVTLVTWAYVSQKARNAARGEPWKLVLDDRRKAAQLYKSWDLDAGPLHLLLLLESPNPSLVNQFEFFKRAVDDGIASVKPASQGT